MLSYSRVQAEVDLDAINWNLSEVRRVITPGTKIMAIIKADGYGHGAIPVAHATEQQVDGFGVAAVQEAVNLRRAGIEKMILILGYTPPEYFQKIVELGISQTVFRYEMAERLDAEAGRQGKKARIHVKVDTGMGRIGFFDNVESAQVVREIAALPHVELEGLFTHFACADEADKTSALGQLARFGRFCQQVQELGVEIPIRHISNSAGSIDLPQADYDMVRCGIATYGMYPSEEVNKRRICLRPALRLVSHVVYVKEVEAGCGISYGSTFVTGRKTRIATIPVGYADGYPRRLSSKGFVLIHRKRAPILGRVCMDQMMVDVTHIPETAIGDSVVLAGSDGAEAITVEELSELAGSFNYEFVCNISKRVPRIYYQSGQVVGSMDYTRNEQDAVVYFDRPK